MPRREPGYLPNDNAPRGPQRGVAFRPDPVVRRGRFVAGVPGDPESRAFGMNKKAARRAARKLQKLRGDNRRLAVRRVRATDLQPGPPPSGDHS